MSSNWTYETSFKLYIGPASSRYLSLSIHFDPTAAGSPVTVSSTLYGCEADRDSVPARQILQYDLIPGPSSPDPEYTGLVDNRLVSGGVGILTDQRTDATMTWRSDGEQLVSLLFRLDRNYSLTSVNILSPDYSSFLLTHVRAELTECQFTFQSAASVSLGGCAGNYLLITLKPKSNSFSISEVELLTEEGQLSGKKYPVTPQDTSQENYSPVTLVLVVFVITIVLTSVVCIVVTVCVYACYRQRRGFERWSFRSLNQRRKGNYETMKKSIKSSECEQQPTAEKVNHDYCTLKIAEELEASLYVDMSSSVNPKPADTPALSTPPTSPPPRSPHPPHKAEHHYMSMKLRAGSSASSNQGGFFARLKYWGLRTQGNQVPEEGDVTTESAAENVGATRSINRRGGMKMKAKNPSTSRPPPPPARPTSEPQPPPADAPTADAEAVSEKEATELSGKK